MTVSLAIVGAGSRGTAYAGYAERYPERARVVAVADPRTAYREGLADRHGVPGAGRFADWQALAERPRLADAVLVTTPDREHAEPVAHLTALGYDILLEKPMAPTEAECEAVVEAALRTGTLLAVCHVLRYTPYTDMVKRLVVGGALEGDGERVTLTDFVTGAAATMHALAGSADAGAGHGGGDVGLMAAFVDAIATGDRSLVRSGPQESLDSHRMAFAAERSRLAGGLPVDLQCP